MLICRRYVQVADERKQLLTKGFGFQCVAEGEKRVLEYAKT
jgi:hypothetical protein